MTSNGFPFLMINPHTSAAADADGLNLGTIIQASKECSVIPSQAAEHVYYLQLFPTILPDTLFDKRRLYRPHKGQSY